MSDAIASGHSRSDWPRRLFKGAAYPLQVAAIVGIGGDHLASFIVSSRFGHLAETIALRASIATFAAALWISARRARGRD